MDKNGVPVVIYKEVKMKDENKKDEKINSLFESCADSAPLPDISVTYGAKRLLREQSAENSRPSHSGAKKSFRSAMKSFFYPVAAVCALLLVTGIAYINGFLPGQNDSVNRYGVSMYSESQLTKTSAEFVCQDFVPFVKAESVLSCEQFTLNVRSGSGENGVSDASDVVMYYIQYVLRDNVYVKLKVEVGAFRLDELDVYKKMEPLPAADYSLEFKSDFSGDVYRLYFSRGIYSYNIETENAVREDIDALIDDIDHSF